MPLLKLSTSVPVDEAKKPELLASLSSIVAKATGKPESYMMVTLSHETFLMAGKIQPAAYADIRGIGGFNARVNNQITKELCDLLKSRLGIDPGKVYATFTDVSAQNWGCNGTTFG